jgi:hypothetical protein
VSGGEPQDEVEPVDEESLVRARRCREALDAGLSVVEANLFADSTVDIGQLRKLVAAECPIPLIALIVL